MCHDEDRPGTVRADLPVQNYENTLTRLKSLHFLLVTQSLFSGRVGSFKSKLCVFQTGDLWVRFPRPALLLFPPVRSQHRLGAKLGQGATSAQLRALPLRGRQAGRQGFTAHQGANENQYGQGIMCPDLTGHETQSASHFSPPCSALPSIQAVLTLSI